VSGAGGGKRVMRIGIDFDNTIVSYDALFHKVAREQDLVPERTPVNKVAVRDHLRRIGREERWTELQGYVYGTRMDEACAYPGAIEFMRACIRAGHVLAIISHKTRYPFLGPRYDLHAAAKAWVETHLAGDSERLVPEGQVFFELTKEEKLARIGDFACDVFIDDLPEIFSSPAFPRGASALLFDPERHHALPGTPTFSSWAEIASHLDVR
jgi:hypothetical protein